MVIANVPSKCEGSPDLISEKSRRAGKAGKMRIRAITLRCKMNNFRNVLAELEFRLEQIAEINRLSY